jgi:predicted membrane metal-binding protein
MQYRQKNYLSFGVMTLIVGGLVLLGLLFYGWQSGQELPVWPALAVVAVNVVAALRLVMVRKAGQNPKGAENSRDRES